MRFRALIASLALPWALACAPAAEPPPLTSTTVPSSVPSSESLAVYRGGEITTDDLDQAVLALPVQERMRLRAAETAPFASLIREIVFERLLLAEAREQGLDQAPEALVELEGLRRQALGKSFLEKSLPPLEEPEDSEILAAFESRQQQFHHPETRSVFHLYRRLDADTGQDELAAELSKIRQRVQAGESFSLLAEQISDSESRHQQGFIGRIVPGQLPAEFESVIFALDEKVPSEPVVTTDGLHLFFVEAIIPARRTSFDEVRAHLRRDLLAERRLAEVVKILDAIDPPEGSFIPETDELEALLRAGDRQAVALRIGDFEIRLGRFLRLVAQEREQQTSHQRLNWAANEPHRILAALVQREKAFLAASLAGEQLSVEAEQAIELQAESSLSARYRRLLIARELDRIRPRLETFYNDNRRRFSSPLRLHLHQLVVPVDERASERMSDLETLHAELEAGRLDLQAAAEKVGGEIKDLKWRRLKQLQSLNPKLAIFGGRLPKGGFSPPYTTAAGEIAMFEVVDRQEPEVLPFDQTKDSVRSSFLQRHGQEIYDLIVQSKLEAAEFAINQDNLSAAVSALASR